MRRVKIVRSLIAFVVALPATASATPQALPPAIRSRLPSGYVVLANVPLSAGHPLRQFEIVALGQRNEHKARAEGRDAPLRPLLIFERQGSGFTLLGRNDTVVLAADQGGQCDPFLDGDATIATKGAFFTVQNGVACGEHWTDYVTFRLGDHSGRFVFDNERLESWTPNPSNDPDAEALVRVGRPQVIRARPGQITPFAVWRPRH